MFSIPEETHPQKPKGDVFVSVTLDTAGYPIRAFLDAFPRMITWSHHLSSRSCSLRENEWTANFFFKKNLSIYIIIEF